METVLSISCKTLHKHKQAITTMYQALKHAFYSNDENKTAGFMHRDVRKIHNALPFKLQQKLVKKN